jgi:hypothetical protein
MLITFAFGLASVFMTNGSLESSKEIFVDLPKTQSDSVIIITPKKSICIPFTGGHGFPNTKEFITEWDSNCLINKPVNSK